MRGVNEVGQIVYLESTALLLKKIEMRSYSENPI